MPTPESFPPAREYYQYAVHPSNSNRGKDAMIDMYNSTTATGGVSTWVSSMPRDRRLHRRPSLEKLNRWVTEHLLHLHGLILGKTDGSANEEMAQPFVLDVAEDLEPESAAVKKLTDLAGASPDGIKLFVRAFDT
ncbi:hypothetical protein ColTof4_13389 [Colletotrichum tofieldiae]|nr:hypothetical protein ColTof3_00536 [Colletotrichum tofieldiae]GKT80966.1 hypothetical protein ColTof4_13389 [Colletotrichum tofieldiae]